MAKFTLVLLGILLTASAGYSWSPAPKPADDQKFRNCRTNPYCVPIPPRPRRK